MFNKNVTLNDFLYSMKQLLYPAYHNRSIFAAEFLTSFTNQTKQANETSEKIHSEFPDLDAVYYNVRATRDYRYGD